MSMSMFSVGTRAGRAVWGTIQRRQFSACKPWLLHTTRWSKDQAEDVVAAASAADSERAKKRSDSLIEYAKLQPLYPVVGAPTTTTASLFQAEYKDLASKERLSEVTHRIRGESTCRLKCMSLRLLDQESRKRTSQSVRRTSNQV